MDGIIFIQLRPQLPKHVKAYAKYTATSGAAQCTTPTNVLPWQTNCRNTRITWDHYWSLQLAIETSGLGLGKDPVPIRGGAMWLWYHINYIPKNGLNREFEFKFV